MKIRRVAFIVMFLLRLIPSSTAWNHVWYAGRPDDDGGAYPKVLPQQFLYNQRHHKCALIVISKNPRYGVEAYLCEFPSPKPNPIPLPGGNGNV